MFFQLKYSANLTINTKPFMQDKKKNLIQFLLIFIGIIALYYTAIGLTSGSLLDSYIKLTAFLSAKFLAVFVKGTYSELSNIIAPRFTLVLSFGCEGSEALVIFLAGVLAFPSSLKNKLYGLLIGLPLLFLLNVFRIMGLYYVGINLSSSFDLFHTIIFPVIFILISVIAWVNWIKIIRQKNTGKI